MRLDFVRGHMGGNLIVLVRGNQLPAGEELETAVKLLGPNYLYAHEAGILYHAGRSSELKVKIVEPTSQCFISACGGFTQVLGSALIETGLGDIFGVDKTKPRVEVVLHTDGGPVKLFIETAGGKAAGIRTDMTSFVRECYQRGVKKHYFRGLEVVQAGKFLVLNAARFKDVCPRADFSKWDQQTRELLTAIQHDFADATGEREYNVALYDWKPEYGGDIRVVYPHCVEAEYFEPSCGTGSIALGIALLVWEELQELQKGSGRVTLKIECGGGKELGGPDITGLEMNVERGLVTGATFSHSRVDITAVGQVWL